MKQFDLALAATKAAAKIVTAGATAPAVLRRKGEADFVTQLDYDVQRFLIPELNRIQPLAGVVSEELEGEENSVADFTWVLDPIDGTTNLLHDNPHFAISLALVEKGETSFGIILNPLTGDLFTAMRGCGAFHNGLHISPSTNEYLEQAIVSVGLPYDRAKAHFMFQNMESVFRKCQDLRRTGSASLDLAYLACGRADGHFEMDLHAWDVCAGALILREAGGSITDWESKPLPVTARTCNIVASNGRIHGQLISALQVAH